MSAEQKNFSNEHIHLNIAQMPSLARERSDHSEFNVLEAKENKLKSRENSIEMTNLIQNHPTTRSEAIINASLSDTGRVKRKCVLESERRKLYLADLDSPPYYQQQEEPPTKLPRVKGRRGRPPKLGPDGFPLRRFPDMERVQMYYQSSIFDGYAYCFSTALANLSCQMVLEGHFKNLVDHHKSISFPNNVFSQDIVTNHISHHKLASANQMNRFPPHMFNQPGPHMFRHQRMNPHMNQQTHVYQNMMHPQQVPNMVHQNNMNMMGNYNDYQNFFQVNNGNNNRRIQTPNQMQRTHQNVPSIPQSVYTHSGAQNQQPNIAYSLPQVNQHPQNVMNPSNNLNNMNHMVHRMTSNTPTHIRNNVVDNNQISSQTNGNNNHGMWMPNKNISSQNTTPFSLPSDKPQTTSSLQSHFSNINVINQHSNDKSDSSMVSKLDTSDKLTNQSFSPKREL